VIKNPYCISKNDLLELWINQQKDRTDGFMKNFAGKFDMQEMVAQMEKEKGEFWDFFKTNTDKFANKTENVEVFMAVEIVDFYFKVEMDVNICFEMRTEFRGELIETLDELVSKIESDTHIDCSIKSKDLMLDFQIKRYPQQYKKFSGEAIIEFLKGVFSGYGEMKNVILAILLQPNTEEQTKLFFQEIHDQLMTMKEKVNFSEVVFIFNLSNKNVVFTRVYPDFVFSHKPIQWRSEKMIEASKK
jgi:hypothetical protein